VRDLAIPAIETRYAGVLFRSRTEARWAKFWDELDIKWDYEPQGFIAAGIPYLPDFVAFPALGMLWVEIKPTWQADPEGVAKWREFAIWRPGHSRAVLFAGTPALEGNYFVRGGSDSHPWEDDTQQWRPCPSGHHFDLAYPGTFRSRYAEDGCTPCAHDGESRLESAVAAALSFKFDKA
jgi:hypothetical protein